MERGTIHLSTSNQNNITIHGNNAVVQTFNPVANVVQQQTAADSKIRRLFTLLNPLVSSTRTGSDVPRDGCLAGTRRELLQGICTFVKGTDTPHVCLILGMAGMGKSALARSIVDTLADSGLCITSYFISRHIPQSRRTERLVQTLAYQLAERDTVILDALLASLESDPSLLQQNVAIQVQRLLIANLTYPRHAVTSPLTIIIDGLDEVEDVSALLTDVAEPLAMTLLDLSRRVKLILSCREFDALRVSRSRGALEGIVSVRLLHKIEETTIRRDMQMFIVTELCRLRERADLDSTWPTDAQINHLTDRAGSLFIYATTVLHFLGVKQYSPKTRLKQLLSSHSHFPTTGTATCSSFAVLDALYLEVLLSFIGTTPLSMDSDLIQQLRLVLAAVIYAEEPMSMRMLSGILDIRRHDLEPIIHSLAAIWIVPEDRDKQLHVSHLSFSEFIGDPSRCTEPCLCIPPLVGHELLATACLRRMSQALHRDICHLIQPGVPLPGTEAYSLGIIEENVDQTLRYACLHGVDTHLQKCLANGASVQARCEPLIEGFSIFCHQHLLHWVEVRAIIGEDSLNSLIQTLHHLSKVVLTGEIEAWSCATRLLAELHDVIYEFQAIIIESPLEIYNMCLALLPNGLLVSAYAEHSDAMAQRVTPRPDKWLGARRLFSQSATATCIATGGKWTACAFVAQYDELPVGQSYVLLWSAMPTAPVRLDLPHADDFALQYIVFSAGGGHLATLSRQSSGRDSLLTSFSFITVWDVTTLQIISLRRVAMRVLGISFDKSGSHMLCVTCDPQVPVVCLPISLDGPITRPTHSTGWYQASFSADRSRVVFGQLRGPLFVADESSLWRPIVVHRSIHPPAVHRGREAPMESHGARILISSDGTVVVVPLIGGHQDKFTLRAWRLARGESPRVSDEFPSRFNVGVIGSPALSHDGRLIAFCEGSHIRGARPSFKLGELRWDDGDDQSPFVPLASWPCDGGMLAQFSNDGRLVAGFDGERVLRIWDVHTSHMVARVEEGHRRDEGYWAVHTTAFKSLVSIFEVGPSAIPSLNLKFSTTGVLAFWNRGNQSHGVILSLDSDSYCPFWPSLSSQFRVTERSTVVEKAANFAAVLAESDRVEIYSLATNLEPGLAVWRLFSLILSPQGLMLLDFGFHDPLVVACGTQIICLPEGSRHGRVFDVGFYLDAAVFSADRNVLAVANRILGNILVVTLRPSGIQFHSQYDLAYNGHLSRMELDSEGSHLLIHYSWTLENTSWPDTQTRIYVQPLRPELHSNLSSSKSTVILPLSWPKHWPVEFLPRNGQWFEAVSNPASDPGKPVHRTTNVSESPTTLEMSVLSGKTDRSLSEEDMRLLAGDLHPLLRNSFLTGQPDGSQRSDSGSQLPFIRNMNRLGKGRRLLDENMIWRWPVLYLNAPQGGPMVLDFAQHPALLPEKSPEHARADGLEYPEEDLEGALPLSDNDYFEVESGSGDE